MITANEYYKQKFGSKVYRLSFDAGLTCPNRDGTLGTGGCIFCLDGSSAFSAAGDDIKKQLTDAKTLVEKKNKGGKYIAYFQSYCGTYAPIENLKKIYSEAIEPDYIVGLSVATRPDCLPDETIALLSEINKIKPVCVELGLQTVNEQTARYIRRGYETAVYFDAVRRLRENGLEVITHIIIGLPGEDEQDAEKTTAAAVRAGTNGVKFHLLHVLRGTDLEKDYLSGAFECLTLERYGEILKRCISLLPPDMVVHRLTGDGARRDLIAPLWSADKKRVLNYLKKELSL